MESQYIEFSNDWIDLRNGSGLTELLSCMLLRGAGNGCRITVAISGLGLTGWQLATMLREEHAVIPELASLKV